MPTSRPEAHPPLAAERGGHRRLCLLRARLTLVPQPAATAIGDERKQSKSTRHYGPDNLLQQPVKVPVFLSVNALGFGHKMRASAYVQVRSVDDQRSDGRSSIGSAGRFPANCWFCRRSICGHTIGVKTAISIPDKIFKKADRLARRLGISRSQLYSEAVEAYVNRRRPESITEAMNRVVDEVDSSGDNFVSAAAGSVLERTEW